MTKNEKPQPIHICDVNGCDEIAKVVNTIDIYGRDIHLCNKHLADFQNMKDVTYSSIGLFLCAGETQ